MTPTFRWVFLLALVGRAASVPRPLVVDACALLCNPGAETESERERDPVLFPRYPKVNCRLQSPSDKHQAFIIASQCLKLCTYELSIPLEVNCFALRSSLEANLGCYCEALTPLSPNTMKLHESWRLDFLVNQLADDILTTILSSPLDTIILCEIHQELFKNVTLNTGGKLVDNCEPKNGDDTVQSQGRRKRSVDVDWMNRPPACKDPLDHPDMSESIEEIMKDVTEDVMEDVTEDVMEDETEDVMEEIIEEPVEEVVKIEDVLDEPIKEDQPSLFVEKFEDLFPPMHVEEPFDQDQEDPGWDQIRENLAVKKYSGLIQKCIIACKEEPAVVDKICQCQDLLAR